MVVFAPARFIHLSTCKRFGWTVRDASGQTIN